MSQFPINTRWNIFCTVIDNYGDIGVCWRLAKQLASEQQQKIRLWVDDLISFQKICPLINPNSSQQWIDNIEINHWPKCWSNETIEIPEILVEAFACQLPEAYITSLAKANKPVLWLNLEYLTYENWSISFHALPSLQDNGLNKYFFFTGHPQTGGIIREHSLLEQAVSFQNNSSAQQQFLTKLGITRQAGAYLIFIFSYSNSQLASWLDSLKKTKQLYQLIIPQTPLLDNLADYLNVVKTSLTTDYFYQQDNLSIQIIPFINQTEFDRLLWCTDFNFIRGEDSFTRAQYAGKPMLWHIYPQQKNNHLTKLQAFLNYYSADLSPKAKHATFDWWFAWNNQQNLAQAWQTYQENLPEIEKHAKKWASNQKNTTDLVTKLAKFYKNWLS